MGPRQKRQKLATDGAEVAVTDKAEAKLSHTKSNAATDPEKQSTLYVRGLADETTTAQLAEHFSDSFPIKHAVVVTDKETGKCKGFGFVTFVDHEDARRAVEEFHGKSFGGKKLNVTLAERRQREEGAARDGAAGSASASREPPQSSKLIVRNLPWSIDTPEKLSKLFLSFGKINQSIVPKDHQGRMKGFGIVMLRGRKNAEQALERLNGKELDGRTLAVDWAADKETWQQAQAAAREAEAQVKAEAKQTDRVDSGQSDTEEQIGEEVASGEESEGDVDDDEDGMDDEDDEEDEGEEDSKSKLTSNEAVLFIRNLPFTTTDEDVYEHFGALYPVRYARIVVDRATERPRGTGFVCFYKKEHADLVLREAPRPTKPQEEVKQKGKKGADAKSGPSILENEMNDPTGNYTIDGRVLQLSRAVDKNEADRLTAEGTDKRNQRDRDKRRLFLLSEGTIPSNSPLYASLSSSEQAMREASAKQRKKLIDSNPSLNVSLTRLSIRNIPRSITTADLKSLARQAVVGFATDVKGGKRQRLSKEELIRDTPTMQEADKERRVKKKGIVKQAKIIFEGSEGSKVDEGSGRSRGYGFIEYYTHRAALMGLRWLNGHAIDYQAKETEKKSKKKNVSKEEMQDRKRRLIVEFAIENAQVVKRRQDRELKARERPRKEKDGTATDGDGVVVRELERSDKGWKGKRGEGKRGDGNRGEGKHGERKQNRAAGKPEPGAARRVADKAKKAEKGAISEAKDKSDVRRVIAKKRRDRKVQRRQAKGKA